MKRFLTILSTCCILCTQALAYTAAVEALNGLRSTQGLAPLDYSKRLERAAMTHSQDMSETGLFSHEGSDGSSVGERVRETGYRWCVVAENIAKGQRDLDAVMQAWAESPGHRRNMLSPDVTEFALVETEGAVWVMVLAAPGC